MKRDRTTKKYFKQEMLMNKRKKKIQIYKIYSFYHAISNILGHFWMFIVDYSVKNQFKIANGCQFQRLNFT